MNLIFLDIDGVLNMYGSSSRTFMKPYGQHIERHLVDRLNYICKNVKDLKIVISSSWRVDMEDLQKQLEEQGFKYWKLVIDKTPFAYSGKQKPDKTYEIKLQFRGQQIKKWLSSNKLDINKYLVIDDETTDICGTMCRLIPKKYVIKIDGNEGMLHKDAIKIINYFKEI